MSDRRHQQRLGVWTRETAWFGWSLPLVLALSLTATGQEVPGVDDLFGPAPDKPATSPAPSAPSAAETPPAAVPPPRLVRTVQDAKILYEDRTRKVVYDCKLYSDDSRVRHGKYVEYYRNGKEFCRGEYRDGLRQGKWTFLRPDGSKAKEGSYVDDKPTGKWMYWRPDGALARQESYKDGLPDGMWLTFGNDGKTPISQIEFAHGQPVSPPADSK